MKKFINNLVTKKNPLINNLVSNSAQMKVLLHTSMGITNYLER